jgi:hypothetical protein
LKDILDDLVAKLRRLEELESAGDFGHLSKKDKEKGK